MSASGQDRNDRSEEKLGKEKNISVADWVLQILIANLVSHVLLAMPFAYNKVVSNGLMLFMVHESSQ